MELSPGVTARCIEVLRITHENPLPYQRLRSELPRDSRYDNDAVLKLAQQLHWIRINESGVVVLNTAGKRLLALNPNGPKRLRRALLDYVESKRPSWISLALDGRSRTLHYAPIGFAQLISEAYLAEGYEDEIVEFWDRLAEIARGQNNTKLSKTGRQGEKLTLAYERRRTGIDPIWRSIESNADGYDVLSVVSREDLNRKQIEVKASTAGLWGSMHLTRNEWDITEMMPQHVFHLWDIKDPHAPQLAVIPRLTMAAHIPEDRGQGRWKEVEISFGEFAQLFVFQDIQFNTLS